jgi:hypothetical protein
MGRLNAGHRTLNPEEHGTAAESRIEFQRKKPAGQALSDINPCAAVPAGWDVPAKSNRAGEKAVNSSRACQADGVGGIDWVAKNEKNRLYHSRHSLALSPTRQRPANRPDQ